MYIDDDAPQLAEWLRMTELVAQIRENFDAIRTHTPDTPYVSRLLPGGGAFAPVSSMAWSYGKDEDGNEVLLTASMTLSAVITRTRREFRLIKSGRWWRLRRVSTRVPKREEFELSARKIPREALSALEFACAHLRQPLPLSA